MMIFVPEGCDIISKDEIQHYANCQSTRLGISRIQRVNMEYKHTTGATHQTNLQQLNQCLEWTTVAVTCVCFGSGGGRQTYMYITE